MATIKELRKQLKEAKEKVNYWKDKCGIIANNNHLCYQHEKREADKNFNNSGISFEYGVENRHTCEECDEPKPLDKYEKFNIKKYDTE